MGDITKDVKSSKLHVEFASCLITLRTVAKFLGFLVFSPYHNASDFPKALKDTFLSVRNQVFGVLGLSKGCGPFTRNNVDFVLFCSNIELHS